MSPAQGNCSARNTRFLSLTCGFLRPLSPQSFRLSAPLRSPVLPVRHVLDRFAEARTELTARPADRDERSRLDAFRDAEKLADLFLLATVDSRKCCAKAERTGGEHQVLRGGINARAGNDVPVARQRAGEDQYGNLVHVLREVGRTPHDAFVAQAFLLGEVRAGAVAGGKRFGPAVV